MSDAFFYISSLFFMAMKLDVSSQGETQMKAYKNGTEDDATVGEDNSTLNSCIMCTFQ
jgi:hypothetical protein